MSGRLALIPLSGCYILSFLGGGQSSCFHCIGQGIDSEQAQCQMEVVSGLSCPALFQGSHLPYYVHLFQLHCSANQAQMIETRKG